jgi:hypothetical protein
MVHSMIRRSTCIDNVFVGSYVRLKCDDNIDSMWYLITKLLNGNNFEGIVSNFGHNNVFFQLDTKNHLLCIGDPVDVRIDIGDIMDIYNDLLD